MTKTTVFRKQSKTLQDAPYQTGAQVWFETFISGFPTLPIFWISSLSFNSFLEKIKALIQSALPSPCPSPCMTASISPLLSLTRHRYPLAEPIKNTCTPWFPFPRSLSPSTSNQQSREESSRLSLINYLSPLKTIYLFGAGV